MDGIKHKAVERIWLLPMAEDGELDYVWCDDPAPGAGMDPADAVEYVRKDAYDARISELEQERDALAAHVERITQYKNRLEAKRLMPARLAGIIEENPAYSLARRDLLKQVEVLEEQAEAYAQTKTLRVSMELQYEADRLRQQAKELNDA